MILESIGWLGAFFFAICAIPQAYESYKNKNSDGIAMLFLVLWILGEIFMFVYVLFQPDWDFPLLANYAFKIILTFVIFYYKVNPTREVAR